MSVVVQRLTPMVHTVHFLVEFSQLQFFDKVVTSLSWRKGRPTRPRLLKTMVFAQLQYVDMSSMSPGTLLSGNRDRYPLSVLRQSSGGAPRLRSSTE